MGAGNFFSKFASVDPLAQALHLPGAGKYAQSEANTANEQSGGGPYAGVAPSLAGANAGYAPGGPGANASYHPFQAQAPGGLFGAAQRFSSAVGDTTPNPAGGSWTAANPGQIASTAQTGQPAGRPNPYGPGPTIPNTNPFVPGAPGAAQGVAPRMGGGGSLFGSRQM
jgi:hypothetical protein